MLAEIIANGDEITSGKILDTNSQWLSRELESLGVSVQYHTAVGDELEAMVDVFRIAMSRADIVITTGGLGPTADDLTRQAFADAIGVSLIEDAESVRHIQEIYARRGVEIPANARRQMFLPEGAVSIRNPHGTAPGIDMTVKRSEIMSGNGLALHSRLFDETRTDFVRLLAYPGVPAEMVEMWNDTGRQTILDLHTQLKGELHTIKDRLIHSFGLGESVVENMLSELMDRNHVPRVGITATQGTITLRIVAEADSSEQCDALIEPIATLIYETLGDRIFGEGMDTLADVVCRKVTFQNKKIAVVEAGTRGLLAAALAGSAESATCFLGGVVVPPRTAIAPERMTEIGRKMFDADYLLLIGAYPEGVPDRTRREEVFVAVVNARDSNPQTAILRMHQFPFVGHPGIIDDLHVKRVLDVFRLL